MSDTESAGKENLPQIKICKPLRVQIENLSQQVLDKKLTPASVDTTVESDCEVLEPDVVLIEIDDDDDNTESESSNAGSYNHSNSNIDNVRVDFYPDNDNAALDSNEVNLDNNEVSISSLLSKDKHRNPVSSDIDVSNDYKEEKTKILKDSSILYSNVVFRITFRSEQKYSEIKNTIMSSLSSAFKEKNLNIQLNEDGTFFDILGIDKTENENNSNDLHNKSNFENKDYEEDWTQIICFNCGGQHEHRNCELPKNLMKIRKKRNKFKSNCERYYFNKKKKFGHLQPGKLSVSLRKALNLSIGEIPPFIYRMRDLGYPPGWLESAKKPHYDTLNDTAVCNFYNMEDSFLESTDYGAKLNTKDYFYDINKIISFPGFNENPGPQYYDDYASHGVPPINGSQSKGVFVYKLEQINAKKMFDRENVKEMEKAAEPNEESLIEIGAASAQNI